MQSNHIILMFKLCPSTYEVMSVMEIWKLRWVFRLWRAERWNTDSKIFQAGYLINVYPHTDLSSVIIPNKGQGPRSNFLPMKVDSLFLNSVTLSISRMLRGIWFHLVWVLKKKFLAKAFEQALGEIELTKHKKSIWLFLSLVIPWKGCKYDGKETGIYCLTILKKKISSKKSKPSSMGIIVSCLNFWMYVDGE